MTDVSKAGLRALRRMKAAEDRDELEDAEVVCEGRICYIGLLTIAKATVYELLRLVLLSDDSEQGKGVERYTLNEEGREMAENPGYRPKILSLFGAYRRDQDLYGIK